MSEQKPIEQIPPNNQQLRRQKRESTQRLEIYRDSVIDFIAVWGPLLSPMVPACLTAAAIIVTFPDLLHIEPWGAWLIAIVTVVALEVLGIVSVETWLDMRRYNAEHSTADEQAPVGQAQTVVVIYAAVVLALVVLLKIWKGAALYSLVPLTLLGLITSWVIVLRKQHNQRVWEVEQSAQERTELDRVQTQFDRLQTQYDELQTQYDKVHRRSDRMQTEYDELRTAYDRLQKQFDLDSVLSELSPAQRDNLLQIVRLVDGNRVTGPADLLDLSDMSKGTVYNAWALAVASRAIYKNGDNSYHATEVA